MEFDSKGLAVDAAAAVTQAEMSTEFFNAGEALPGAQAMGISDEPVTSSASCLVKGNTPTPNYSEALAASASNWADCMDAIESPENNGIFTISGQDTRNLSHASTQSKPTPPSIFPT